MRNKGELVRRGSLTEGGDVEYWDSKAEADNSEEGAPLLSGQ